MKFRSLISIVATLAFTGLAHAHAYNVGDLHIGHPYARATAPGQPAAGAYISVTNKGKTADKLVSASSPAAKTVEIHTMTMEGNVMRMRALESFDIQPDQTIKMQPGHGEHIMLIGLTQALKAGDSFPMTLVFEKAGKIDVSVKVEALKSGGNKSDDAHAHH